MKMKEYAVKAAIAGMIEAGLDIDDEESYKTIVSIYEEEGWENQQIFNYFLERTVGEVNNKYLAAAIVAYRRAREANLLLYPNVNHTLVELMKAGIKLAVVSDAPSREAWMRIYYLNLHHHFDFVLTFDDTNARKPSPIPFQMALKELKTEPSETLMVGDWPERDVAGANNLGIRTIFARYGDSFGTIDSGADWDINDVFEIVGIVNELNSV
tara:strand:- start:232 stop:867 length:636 start_codon:yes stop_codon:yes gene_type:complete